MTPTVEPAHGEHGAPEAGDPFEDARRAAAVIAERTGVPRHDLALVLGSGWAQAGDLIGETVAELDPLDLPGFAAPAVPGHRGGIRSVRLPDDASLPDSAGLTERARLTDSAGGTGERRALVFGTRTHYYEGRGVRAVAHPVRTAAAAGCRVLVLTNGCGGLRSEWPPGTPVLISDHINLTGASPLEGATFVDLTDLYSSRLRALARQVDPALDEGVYVQFTGPHYETPAEIRMARTIGGDLVGMSTALEAIAARHAGLEVLGLSLVTNLAAGLSGQPLSHEEVVAAGRASAGRCGRLLADLAGRL